VTPTVAEQGTIPRPVKFLLFAFFLTGFATVAQITIIGKQVFDMTGRELDLGLLGFAEFFPLAVLAPFTGSLADRLDRRIVFACGLLGEIMVSVGLFLFIRTSPTNIGPIFLLVTVYGVSRAVASPAARALPIDLAPRDVLERVTALRSVAYQAGVISGPIAAGVLFLVHPAAPYLMSAAAYIIGLCLVVTIPRPATRKLATTGGVQAFRDAREGLRFIRRQPVVFGAITLDLFAVLFGGVVALLPAICEKRLGVGAVGLGGLRASIGAGATGVAILLSVRPLRQRIGPVLLAVVGLFGVMTIVIGLTRSYLVAFLALAVASAGDAVSVFIRSTLVPLATPEEMRGRVLAVENVFIGASNELGAVESGITAAAFGLVGAVLFGGIGTLLVVAVWWRYFPDLRRVNRFSDVRVN
jgi:MFS family permease